MVLEKKIGEFTFYGKRNLDASFFKTEVAREWDKGEDQLIQTYFDYVNGDIDERGRILCLYDYKNGGIGSVYVELTPFVDEYKDENGTVIHDLSLSYVVYSEYNGNVQECGDISIGNEEDLVSALKDTILATTQEFANLKFN